MRAMLVSGGWGQNIGNAFFNLAGKHTLEAAGFDVSFVQDSPAYWTFRNEAKGAYPHAWNPVEHLSADLLVLQGPLFTRNFAKIWGDVLRNLRQLDVQWAALSSAFRKYTEEEVEVLRSVVAIHPPLFISTRDRETTNRIREVFPEVRGGVDSAFFLSWAYAPPALRSKSDDFITFCFDHYGEPRLVKNPKGNITIDGATYVAEHSSYVDRFGAKSKGHAYLAHALDMRRLPSRLGNLAIVRPEHRTNPHIPQKIYKRSGGVASDEPWTYLAVYANTTATYSDRVHACVATLAYGRPAMLHNPGTKRSSLFEAIGVQDIFVRPVLIPRSILEDAYEDLITYLGRFT